MSPKMMFVQWTIGYEEGYGVQEWNADFHGQIYWPEHAADFQKRLLGPRDWGEEATLTTLSVPVNIVASEYGM